jgi:glycosyltransferase involved in cell wall biosynthesis
MRVAINGTFWGQPATGSGQYIRQLARALAELEPSVEQTLVFPGLQVGRLKVEGWNCQPPTSNLQPFGLSLRAKPPTSNLQKLLFEQLGFPRAARRLGADLAHVPYFAPPLFPTIPTVVTIHDLIPLILPAYRNSWQVRLYMQLVAMAAPRATAIIADSECSRRDVVRLLGIPAERVHVVYLAADERFRPPLSPLGEGPGVRGDLTGLDAVRQKYGLPECYALYLGGFDRRKNLQGLLAAYTRVVREAPDAPPLVIGGRLPDCDSAFSPDPRRLAGEAGLAPAHVRFIGWVDEVDKPALYSAALVFIFPSIYEGFGLPLLEAMACGVPVIASNAASLPEVVGTAGWLVAPDDPAGLAQAILRVIGDPALAAGLRARSLAQAARFSWRRCAEETLAVYRQVIRPPPSR